jgi:hypothetical protein
VVPGVDMEVPVGTAGVVGMEDTVDTEDMTQGTVLGTDTEVAVLVPGAGMDTAAIHNLHDHTGDNVRDHGLVVPQSKDRTEL